MKRIFVTHIVPKGQEIEHGISVAACNFSHNLIDSNIFDDTYSVLPTFIGNNVKPFKGLIISGFRRNRWLRRIAWIPENIRVFFKIPKRASVWYYNCTTLNMLLIEMLRFFKPSVQQNLIILDYTPSSKPLSKFLLKLSNRMHGTICLADSPLFTVKNTVTLPGVVPNDNVTWPQVEAPLKKEFLISGALGDNIAMLPTLLEAFAESPNLTLHITGKAPDPALVESYAEKYPNIIYHGMVTYEEYLEILHRTPFMLSTRNPDAPENQCNFPSKIIEALLHNRIIISTICYRQIEGIKYFKVSADSESLRNNLECIASTPNDELIAYANQAEEVHRRFSCEVWKQAIKTIEQC